MITASGKYYLYRHIRLDKNEPFYIGIGTKKPGNTFIQRYIRAYSAYDRRKIWRSIVAKTAYEIEIVMESNDRKFILDKEIEFIQLYGRKDIRTGSLSNLTDGGEGGSNKSREQLDKELETRKATGSYYRNKERFNKWVEENTRGKEVDINAKPAYIYDTTGKFIKEFRTMSACAVYVGITRSLVCKMCREKWVHLNFVFSDKYLGDTIDVSHFTVITRNNIKKKIAKYTRNWELVHLYDSAREAAKMNRFHFKNLKFVVDRKIKYRSHNYRILNGNNTLQVS